MDLSKLKPIDVIIGSYTDGKQGPGVFRLPANTKEAVPVLNQINPSYILRLNGYYYVVAQHKDGLIVTLDSNFKVLARVKSMGDDPCHISHDNTGNFIVVTNYSSGSFIISKLQNHIPTIVHSFVTFQGSSNHPQRQASSHPHSTAFSQDNKALFLADLGTDIVYYYEFDNQKIVWIKQKSLKLQNTGPRTLTNGRKGSQLLYLSGQLDNTVRVLTYRTGGLQQLAAYKVSNNVNSFLSECKYFSGQVYCALRGDDKMMVFKEKEDELQMNCSFKVASWPRHFSVTQQGFLYVSCQKGNCIQKYLFEKDKILMLSEISVVTPSVTVLLE